MLVDDVQYCSQWSETASSAVFERRANFDRKYGEDQSALTIMQAPRGFSTAKIHSAWIKEVIVPFFDGEPGFLIVDDAPSHKTVLSEETATRNGIATQLIPSHRTGELQAMDVGVFGPMRTLVGEYFLADYQLPSRFDDSAVHCIE